MIPQLVVTLSICFSELVRIKKTFWPIIRSGIIIAYENIWYKNQKIPQNSDRDKNYCHHF